MKKVFKIILCIVLAVIIPIIGGCAVILGIISNKEKNYWKYSETGGDLLQLEMMVKTPEPATH